VRRWKVAISLAVVAALAAPMTIDKRRARGDVGLWHVWQQWSAEDKAEIEANRDYWLQRQSQEGAAQYLEDITKMLNDGGHWRQVKISNIWFERLMAALLAFVAIFCLAMVLPAIARRYWRWLKT
jgi:hypothetical protein